MNWTPTQPYRNTFLLILMACIIVLAALASNQFFLSNINSDYLFGFEAAQEIIHHHTMAGQNFPIAPYYFPDLIFVVLLNGLTQNITVLHFLYAVFFLMAFVWVVYHLFQRLGLVSSIALRGACFAMLWSFLILPPGIPLIREWSFSHLSVLLCSLYIFSEYLYAKDHPTSVAKLVLLGMISFCVLISDNLLFLQLFVPLGILLLLDKSCQQTNKRFWFGMLLIFGVVTLVNTQIQGLFSILFGSSVSYNISLFRIKNITHLAPVFSHAWLLFRIHIHENPLFYTMIGLYHLMTLSVIFILYRDKRSVAPFPHLARALSFLYLSQALSVILAIIAGRVEETAHFRYFHLIYFYPAIALALCYSVYRPAARAIMGLNLVCFMIFLSYNFHLLSTVQFAAPYNSTIQCVDDLKQQYPIQNGVADYWILRPVRLLSKQGLQLSQVNSRLQLHNFLDNRAHFFQDDLHHTPLTYQFILTANLSQDVILQKIGKPDVVKNCPGTEVWLYLSVNPAAKLNHFFNQQISHLHE